MLWIAAHSPQAKGRVERSFGTAQDRLVKGLRVAGASTLEEAKPPRRIPITVKPASLKGATGLFPISVWIVAICVYQVPARKPR